MLKNDDGTDFLPLKLTAIMITASVILVCAAQYTLAIISGPSVAEARACATRVACIAMAEYAEGCPDTGDGTYAVISVPGNVKEITFSTVYAGDSGESRTGMYTIRYKDGSSETYFTWAPLGAGGTDNGRGGPVILYPGRYSVRISVESINGSPVAILYPEAA